MDGTEDGESRRRRTILVLVTLMLIPLGFAARSSLRERVYPHSLEDMARNDAYQLAELAALFKSSIHRPPATLSELAKPPAPHRPLLETPPKDPWGHDYTVVSPARRSGDVVDIVSAGRDGIIGTGDDLGNWPLDGKASPNN